MYTYVTVHKNKIAPTVSFIMTVVALGAMFFASTHSFPYASVVQLLSVMVLTVAIYLLTSFALKTYTYKVDLRVGNDRIRDGYDFYIIENRGKRNIPLVRIDLKYLRALTPETKENRKALREDLKARGECAKFYTYCPDLCPRDAVWAYFDGVCDGVSGDIAIRFCPDEKLPEMLRGFLTTDQSEFENGGYL